jgi:nucleoid-associated protein YgaU
MKLHGWKIALAFAGIVIILNGCSGSKKPASDISSEDGGTDVIAPTADAGTDAVPGVTPENPTPGAASATMDSSSPNAAPSPDPSMANGATSDAGAALSTVSSGTDSSSVASRASSSSGQTEEYAIKEGDTLMRIAFEILGDPLKWKEIYEANREKLSNPNRISSGVVLKVEKPSGDVSIQKSGEKYLIKRGDTLGTISKSVYGTPTKWRKIWENNKQLIRNPNKIFAGFYLYYLPDEDSSSRNPASVRPNRPYPAAVH